MGSHVLTTPAMEQRRTREPATSGDGARGLPLLADLLMVLGVALTASLLGLAIGAVLGQVFFAAHSPDIVVSTNSLSVPAITVDASTGPEPAPPRTR